MSALGVPEIAGVARPPSAPIAPSDPPADDSSSSGVSVHTDGVLIHPHDAAGDEEWRGFVAAQGFGHPVAAGTGRPVPIEHAAKLRAIRGLRLDIEHVRAKLKYGGNVDDAHREAVAERLAWRAGPGDAAALAHLRHRS